MDAARWRPGTLPLAVWLATRGLAMRASLGLVVLGAVASVAAVFAGRGKSWAPEVPAISAMALAWGAGVTVAFAGALKAFRRDREDGVLALVRARGASVGGYAAARVAGLVVVLGVSLGGATLLVGLAATATAPHALTTARAALAALVYALAFAATLGPVGMAALGARTRAGGYFTLLAVLVLPEIVAPWTSAFLPRACRGLTSIPAALDAVRLGIARPGSALQGLCALALLAIVIAASLVAVRARVPGEDAAEDHRDAWR